MNSITVVGSGIIGLTSAIALQEAGMKVKLVAKEKYALTLSSKVGAVWFPFQIEPREKTDRWAGQTYQRYLKEFCAPGISFLPFLNASNSESNDDWVKQLPAGKVRKALSHELPIGMEMGYIAEVPLAEPLLYLPFLFDKFITNGGSFSQKSIANLHEMSFLDDWVVNCTGLGAKNLCQDEDLRPMRGQILRCEKMDFPSFADPTKRGALSYIINRSGDSVIGGTDYENDWNENEDPEDTQRILGRLTNFGIKSAPKILEVIVGLRPKRSAVRFEFDHEFPNIFHNYGHGGAGFTVCWGCAEDLPPLFKNKKQ